MPLLMVTFIANLKAEVLTFTEHFNRTKTRSFRRVYQGKALVA
jgi:hypothetical protein